MTYARTHESTLTHSNAYFFDASHTFPRTPGRWACLPSIRHCNRRHWASWRNDFRQVWREVLPASSNNRDQRQISKHTDTHSTYKLYTHKCMRHVHMWGVCEMCLHIERSTCFEVIYLCFVLPFAHACSPALSTTKESTYIPRKKLLHSRIVTVSVNLAWRSLCYAHASYLACVVWVARYSGLGFRVSSPNNE